MHSFRLFSLFVAVLCMSQILAQDPMEIVCLRNLDTDRVLLSTAANVGNYPGYTRSSDLNYCNSLPFVAFAAQNGFATNYCLRLVPEAATIYCPEPMCACRYNTVSKKYEVRRYDNSYAGATDVCYIQKNSTYTGATKIDYTKCQAVINQSYPARWTETDKACSTLQ